MFSRKYVFQMKTFTYEITFACKSKEEYERWMDAFNTLQRDTEQRKKEVLKKQNLKNNVEDRQDIKLIKSSQLKKQL